MPTDTTDFEITFFNNDNEAVHTATVQAENDWQACLMGWEMLPAGATDFQVNWR